MDALAESLVRSPELFPHALDLQAVTVIRLSRADYTAASFLDERILGAGTLKRSLSWSDVERTIAAAALAESCRFIFHIGHVGSTLLSRLIGSHGNAFSLREPGILRMFAQIRSGPSQSGPWGTDGFESRLGGLLKLYSRTFDAGSRVIVKATSFVSEMAAEILSRPSQPVALLMFVPAETYLATILGGANAPLEASALAPMRRARLERRLGQPTPATKGIGETVAMSWASEMTSLASAANAAENRILWLSFDVFLAQPRSNLAACFRHFALSDSDEFVTAALSGPDMHRYAKAPEHAYDAKLREAVLNEARSNFGDEIRRGLTWLDRLAKQHAIVREAINIAIRDRPAEP